MVQYFLLNSDGDINDNNLGLTSDTIGTGGVLSGDNYIAEHVVDSLREDMFLSDENGSIFSQSFGGTVQSSSVVEQLADGFSETTAGKYGVNFNGYDSENEILIEDENLVDLSGNITISFDIALDNATSQPYRANPIDKAYGGEFAFTFEDSNQPRLNVFFGSAGGDTTPYITHSWNLSFNDHERVRITFTRRNSQQETELWVNNTSQGVRNDWEEPSRSTEPLQIGSGYTNPIDGQIYDVQIYTQSVSDAEVSTIVNGNTISNLAHHWKLDDAWSNTAYDVTDNNANGTVNGEYITDVEKSSILSSNSTSISSSVTEALRNAFAATTFGQSSSETNVDSITQLFNYSDIRANLDTSTIVTAFTDSFDAIDRTAHPDAFTNVESDTTVATGDTTQSFGDALAEPLVASETALFAVEDGESFGDAYADSLETDAFIENTIATSNTAVTSLGQIETSLTEPQFEQALVEIFAFVSPESVSASDVIATPTTEADVNGVIQNTTTVPITPRMDIVVAVRSAQLDIEGKFSDSLSASVGAETFLSVSHTVVDTETFDTTESSETLAEVFETVGSAITTDTIETTSVGAQALREYAVYSALTSDSFSTSNTLSTIATANTSTVDSAVNAEALPTATVKEFVFSELDGTVETDVTAESLATVVQTLVSEGIVDSQTDAAAIVSNVVASEQRSDEYTEVLGEAELENITVTKRNIRATSEALIDTIPSIFSGESTNTEIDTESVAVSIITIALSDSTNGSIEAVSTAIGNVHSLSLTPIEAVFRILFAAYTGNTVADIVRSQRTELMDTKNGVKIINE